MSRRRFWLLVAGLLTAALVLVGCGSSSADQSAGQGDQSADPTENAGGDNQVRQITITASNFKFDQEVYTVNKGETIEIVLENAEGYHEAIIDGYDVELKPSEPITFVADEVGEFDLFCSVVCGPIDDHNNMRAKFVVVE